MSFDFQIPRARFKEAGFRAKDGHLIKTLKKIRRCKKAGERNRRHIVAITEPDGTERIYHATKGWRSYRA